MKTRLIIFKDFVLFLFLYSAVATTAVFGQTTYTWTGVGDSTNLGSAANWTPTGGPPSGATQDTGQWDGLVAGDLTISYTSSGGLPGTGFATKGVNWNLTSNQAGSVTLVCPAGFSANIAFKDITVAGGAGALTLGDNTFHGLNLIARPAGDTHNMINNSTNPVTVGQSVFWQPGGGNAFELDFGGTGNWVINNYLRSGDGGPTTIVLEGPGSLIWSADLIQRGNAPLGPIVINGGTMILKSTNLVPAEYPATVPFGNNVISNNATLIFDAASQSDVMSRVISGTGQVIVSDGTLTLAATNTYTGKTVVTNNGTLVASSVGGDMEVDGGTLVPTGVGAVGTLSVAGNMDISSGTVLVTLNKALSPSNSAFAVAGAINNSGGTLKLLNFGPDLVIGDRFAIFNQPVAGGAGMTIISPGFTVQNDLALDGSVTVNSVAAPGTDQITLTVSGGNLNLSWPTIFTGLHLQAQTNPPAIGVSTNWISISGTEGGNSYLTPLNDSNGSVFFRLAP